jgi:LacI family transcriptional regulator
MPLVDSVQPPLTTVAIPQRRIGTEAARLLLERLGGDAAPAPRVLLGTELIVRASTRRPKGPGGRPSAAQDGGEAVDSRTTSSGSS